MLETRWPYNLPRVAGLPIALTAMAISQYCAPIHAHEYQQVGLPLAHVFSPTEHGGHNQNWHALQARNGRIYIGHTSGLSEWDGEAWRNYSTAQGTAIRSLSQWSDDRLYLGTTNDIGFFYADRTNELQYKSLLDDWSHEEKQFGEVWATAANQHGVVFITDTAIFHWNGDTLSIIENATPGRHRIFALEDRFVYKEHDTENLIDIRISTAGTATHFAVTPTSLRIPGYTRLRNVLVNREGKLVAVTEDAGIYVQESDRLVQRTSAEQFGEQVAIHNAIQAQDGYYYIASLYDGLFILNESFELLRQYDADHNIAINTVFSVMEDRQQNIWLAGIPNVVKMLPPHRYSMFKAGTVSTEILRVKPYGDSVMAVGNGLFVLEAANAQAPPSFRQITQSNDSYLDTVRYSGLFLYSGLGGVYSPNSTEPSTSDTPILKAGLARTMRIDPNSDELFVGTSDGLFRITSDDGKLRSDYIDGTADHIQSIEFDAEGALWMGTSTQELYRLSRAQLAANPRTIDEFGAEQGIRPGSVWPFRLDNRMLFMTSGGLLEKAPTPQHALQPATGFPQEFAAEDANIRFLYSDKIQSELSPRLWYQVDQQRGYLRQGDRDNWIAHNEVFGSLDPLPISDMYVNDKNVAWVVLDKGDIYRLDVQLAESLPPLGLLNIHSIVDAKSNARLQKSSAEKLDSAIHPDDSSLRISYALADNTTIGRTEYRHRLLGTNQDFWSEWTRETYKDLTSLEGVDYLFEVEARDAWHRASRATMSFSVLPYWYETKSAKILLILFGFCLLLVSGWLGQRLRTRHLLARNLELEQVVTLRTRDVQSKVEQLRQQQILKDRFFNNVSHEFRTPLTLTIGPLETIVSEHARELQQPVKHLASAALENSKKMLAMVGQVLDMNRLEAGQLTLRVALHDVSELVRSVQPRFTDWAQQHDQTIALKNCEDPLELWFDRDQLDSCLANLLSNAIKYSGNGSQIVLNIVMQTDRVGIRVEDDGVGLAQNAQHKVFERFYQEKASERITHPGTGIGLAIVKEIMELHSGSVELTSEPGQGCCFTLWLRRGNDHFDSVQLTEPLPNDGKETYPTTHALATQGLDDDDKTTLLIIDDNAELINFISLRLAQNYRILRAKNGQEGYSVACDALPDLIVSDVSMPGLSGLDLVKKLKSTAATEAIPVILLTAKATKRETVEGFASGADDYITKPFDTSELVMRVNAQINARKKIRETIELEQSINAIGQGAKPTFLQRLNETIEAHLGDAELNVQLLSDKLHMSRDTLTRRCKDELATTPLAHINTIRMHHASVLLKRDRLSVSEIAYGVGFQSLAYFSRRFKQYSGYSPSKYAAAQKH
ncbi:MAG: ATP-binding protein [Pseudomonadota bacterium]